MYGQDQIINSEIAWQAGRLRPRHLAANVHEISEARQPPDNVNVLSCYMPSIFYLEPETLY
jgi:hypothetical protein